MGKQAQSNELRETFVGRCAISLKRHTENPLTLGILGILGTLVT